MTRLSPAGVATRIAGAFTPGFSGNGGPARAAQMHEGPVASGLAIDAQGNVFFSDGFNRRIRAIRLGAVIAPPNARGAPTGGTPEWVVVNTLLARPLEATVLDDVGNPANGVRVDFTAPASGPSCFFLNGASSFSALTDRSGKAQASCVANGVVGSYTITATPLAATVTASFALTNTADVSGNPVPQLNANGLVNAASFAPGAAVAPGSIVAVFGTQLARSTDAAGSLPLPLGLLDSRLFLGGIAAPYFFASPSQLNVQVPFELAQSASTGVVALRGARGGSPITTAISPFSPGIFTLNNSGSGQGAIVIATTGEVVAPSGSVPGRAARPADRGENISIYATGLGGVTNAPATGAAALTNPLSVSTTTPTVTIGGVAATVSFSGLAPFFVGLYQVNAQVPANAPAGNAVEVVLTAGGVSSNKVTIAIE